MLKSFLTGAGFFLLAGAFCGCKKNRQLYVPETDLYFKTLQTSPVSATITAGYSGIDITNRGVCYNFQGSPTVSHSVAPAGKGAGDAQVVINNLEPGKTYYIRSFATNKEGTGYSEERSFTTPKVPNLFLTGLMRTTNAATVIVDLWDNAHLNGTIGICYNTTDLPTVNDNYTETGLQQGTKHTRYLSNLIPGQKYYARAYVRMQTSVYYGPVSEFSTYNGQVNDVDGNIYYTIKIGNQEWLASNLKVTRFRDGSAITQLTQSNWHNYNQAAYGIPQNNTFYVAAYGQYYNTQAITDPRGLAPIGWHIPSKQEWKELFSKVGNPPGKLCAQDFYWENSMSDDAYGFMAMPNGFRDSYGDDSDFAQSAHLWTSSSTGTETEGLLLSPYYYNFQAFHNNYNFGLGVRCVKD